MVTSALYELLTRLTTKRLMATRSLTAVNSLMALLLFMFAGSALAATFTATVDRTIIAPYETLDLTLRTDKSTDLSPDLSALNQDFEVVTTRQNRQIRIVNGQTESWFDWIVTLAPKHEGHLTIPALKLGNLSSEPIRIQVQKDSSTGNNVSPVFMRTEVDNEFVYVQQQVVLTLRVFYRVNLYDDSRLSPLNIEGAIVQQLGDTRKYETIIDGKRYGVFELKFAIHPQKTGPMEIPELVFNGTMAERNDPFGSMFSLSNGKPVVARSAEIILNVQPQPASYSGRAWLPASDLSLSESWSQDLNDGVHVGDAITRTITVEADGLTSAQLPTIPKPRLQNANIYPDQSKTEDTPTDTGIIGKRMDAVAIIPTQPGNMTLPALRYSWFDVTSNEEKVAELPARTIRVLPAANAAAIPALPAATPIDKARADSQTADCPPPEVMETTSPTTGNAYLWPFLTGLFALLWLISTSLWLLARRQRIPVITDTVQEDRQHQSEADAFKLFREGCEQRNVNEVKLALTTWCQSLFNEQHLSTVERCLTKLGSTELRALFQQMDSAVYSPDKSDAPFPDILRECEKLRNQHLKQTKKNDSLPGLYPTD
ncbi:BatD family protein [Endozoicomonas lisbonensis]|uniref:Protein BatD n=1 Tax=Endozoicomonas lisbonensis TaxID=3120522 RepID=A0ABV2SLX9_9GAMM